MPKPKLLITDGLSADGLEMLEKSGLFEVSFHKSVDKESLKGMLPDFDALIIRSATKMTKELIDCATKLKVIMRAGAGVDNVDVGHATSRKILVLNCPGVNNNAVAELTIGFLFGLLREIPRATAGMKANLWEKKELVGGEAAGRTLGLLGFGAIGNLVGRACSALGMNVIVFDPRSKELAAKPEFSFVKQWHSSVDEVFAAADVVSMHMPLMDSTRNCIGSAQFAKMKKGTYFINCARGGIADEAALLEHLNNGTIAGAALDVFAQEPTPPDHPLVKHPKVICAPHIGAATREAQHKVGLAAARYLIDYFQEGRAPTAVNNV
jgi:D-3-phosphoglycerate dehydrogenase / 2-oxoglutarate reductase